MARGALGAHSEVLVATADEARVQCGLGVVTVHAAVRANPHGTLRVHGIAWVSRAGNLESCRVERRQLEVISQSENQYPVYVGMNSTTSSAFRCIAGVFPDCFRQGLLRGCPLTFQGAVPPADRYDAAAGPTQRPKPVPGGTKVCQSMGMQQDARAGRVPPAVSFQPLPTV